MSRDLGARTWTEVGSAHRGLVLAVPLGSCEQHGPHLPLDTDTRIAIALAGRLAERATAAGVVAIDVAPPLTIGASWEHRGFPGLLSITNELLTDLLVELARSAEWADGLVFVNGHGGNARGVDAAVGKLTAEGHRVLSWWPRVPGGDAHAGRTETSIMLSLDPSAVQTDRLEPGFVGPVADVVERAVAAASPNGILGDPTSASADEGDAVLGSLTDDLVTAVTRWHASWTAS